MPISHTTDRVRRRMYTRAEGLVTFDEINTHLDILLAERGTELPEMIDARDAITNVTVEEVRRLVARAHAMSQVRPLGPTAILTADDHLYGMARMYAILCESIGAPVQVFRDEGPAIEWLDGWVETHTSAP